MGYWVGLDTGVRMTAVCIVDEAGAVIAETSTPTDAASIVAALGEHDCHPLHQISVEAGVGTQMVRDLKALGYPVRIFDTAKSSRFLSVRRQKTDAGDARGLADLGRLGTSIGAEVLLRPMECQTIRMRLTIRAALVRQRKKIDALVQNVVRLHGGEIKILQRAGALREAIAAQAELLHRNGLDIQLDLIPLVDLAEAIREQEDRHSAQLKRLAAEHPVCSLLLSVPGVGALTALAFYSAVGEPTRFRRSRDVGPYFGLTPTLYQSGENNRQGRISRTGCKATRTLLVSSATVLLNRVRADSDLKAWGHALAARVGMRKARIATARKLATVLLQIWKTGRSFEPMMSTA